MTFSSGSPAHARGGIFAASLLLLPCAAQGQGGSSPAPPPVAESPAALPDGEARLQPVEIKASRPDDVQERRNSTAAKIIVGRDEIDRYGDSTLGEVLKRLPGVTIQGRPGRGGAIRLRGLGSGYTQILLDGQRVPPGFALDSIAPDQIERIEILRAPTAETGARAIAGTINIVTRGGFTRAVNDMRLAAAHENGKVQPSFAWSRNLGAGDFIVHYSLNAFHVERDNSSRTTTIDRRLDDGTVILAQVDDGRVRVRGDGVHASARLQWRPQGGADTVTLTPFVVYNRFRSHREGRLEKSIGVDPAPYDRAVSDGSSTTSMARLNGEWTHRLGGADRIEWRAGVGRTRMPAESVRRETTGGAETRSLDDTSRSVDTSATASVKLARTVFGEHSLVSGAEVESSRRDDSRVTVQRPDPFFADFGDNLSASALRLAGYAQDEWSLSEHWSAQAGLRWEAIRTRGSVEQGGGEASNRSSVWSPLLHAVWKPDPKGRDQVRIGLTRSYRSPTLANLIARPSFNTRYPIDGPNTPTQPDRAGNPNLRPELATGIDVAVERYLPGSGLLSAAVFHRSIENYMRSVTRLESVSWSGVPRYVLRPQNTGDAITQGIELEAKFRVSDLWAGAPRTDVRANAGLFRSRVKGVPGPDNRLDQQPAYSANLGADHRFAGLSLTVGGNLNWTPAYTTQLSDAQSAFVGRKLVVDAYALWAWSPGLQFRFTLSNLDPRDYVTAGSVDGPDRQGVPVRETSRTTQPTWRNAQLRMEMKL